MNKPSDVLQKLRAIARPDHIEGMVRYGMTAEKRLGISVPELRKIAKELGRDHKLALALWETGIPEARIVASLVADPDKLTEEQMEHWVNGIDSWDVCDQVCMNLFDKSPLAWKKIVDWSARAEEFVKRTGFSLMASLAVHDKTASDKKFMAFFPLIKREAGDERNFVKKAVNWALRNIGKRNLNLNTAALETATAIRQINSSSARWIASDALRELESESVQKKLRKKLNKIKLNKDKYTVNTKRRRDNR